MPAADPFLFFGQGFATSERALECFAWFSRPPGARARTRLVARLPAPVASFARFDGPLLHFGSDDTFPGDVAGTGDPLEVPTRAHWRAFCAAFEQAMHELHTRNRLVAVLKSDDGTYGRRLGRWHARSVRRADELAALAVRRGVPVRGAWSAMAMNLLEDVLPDAAAARRWTQPARARWLAWLNVLTARGSKPLRPVFAERLTWVLTAVPARDRDAARASLGAATRRALDRVDVSAPARPRRKAKRATPPNPAHAVRAAVREEVLPWLRAQGFAGSLPTLRRIGDDRTHLSYLAIDGSMYGRISVRLAVLAARHDTTIADDDLRSFNGRSPSTFVSDLVPADVDRLLWYEDAQKRWGKAWPRRLAEHLRTVLADYAEPWLERGGRKRRR